MSSELKFRDYGTQFGQGDVLGCYIDYPHGGKSRVRGFPNVPSVHSSSIPSDARLAIHLCFYIAFRPPCYHHILYG